MANAKTSFNRLSNIRTPAKQLSSVAGMGPSSSTPGINKTTNLNKKMSSLLSKDRMNTGKAREREGANLKTTDSNTAGRSNKDDEAVMTKLDEPVIL